MLLKIADVIDRAIDALGRAVAWLMIGLVLVTLLVVVLRYGFRIGFAWMQESLVYMHGTAFLVGSSYALLHDRQVRLDLLYARLRPRTRAWIDIAGCLLIILPMCVLMVTASFNYVINSWMMLEGSMHRRGIPAVFLLKTMLWVFSGLLALQATAIMIRSGCFLAGRADSAAPTVGTKRSDVSAGHG